MKLIFATHNPGKIIEMQALLRDLDIEVLSAERVGVTEDAIEDGKTFSENALKKARFVSQKTGEWAVADDSGLCIKALNGAPGIATARWAGEDYPRDKLAGYTLRKMEDVPEGERQAYFESSVALVSPEGESWVFQGKVAGQIAQRPQGKPRPKLPYDLIFIPEGHSRTFAEMSEEEKNSMSHRGLAFKKLREFLAMRRLK